MIITFLTKYDCIAEYQFRSASSSAFELLKSKKHIDSDVDDDYGDDHVAKLCGKQMVVYKAEITQSGCTQDQTSNAENFINMALAKEKAKKIMGKIEKRMQNLSL